MSPPPPPCGGDPLEAPPGAGVQQTEPQECLKRSAQNHTSPDPSALSASTEEERRGGGGGRGVQKMLSCPLRFIVCSLGIQQMLSNQRRLLTVNAFNMTQPPPPSTLPPQWSLWSVRSQSGELCATGPVVFKALTPVRGFRGVWEALSLGL